MNHKQTGFTLIELIIVIVILGILAVTAAPKFIDLSGDAIGATVKARAATLKADINLVYAKAIIENKLSGNETISTANGNVKITDGYPYEHSESLNYFVGDYTTQVDLLISDACPHEYCYQSSVTNTPIDGGLHSERASIFYPKGYTYNDRCKIVFSEGQPPKISVATSEC
jgi:prepilin-type N-terminal cleavage/methylation domain-containing protein